MTDVYLTVETIWTDYVKAPNETVKIQLNGTLKGSFKTNDVGAVEIGPSQVIFAVNDIVTLQVDETVVHKAASLDIKLYSLHNSAQIMLFNKSKDIIIFFAVTTNNCSASNIVLKLQDKVIKEGKTDKCTWNYTDSTGILFIGAEYSYEVTSVGYNPASGIAVQRTAIE